MASRYDRNGTSHVAVNGSGMHVNVWMCAYVKNAVHMGPGAWR